MNIDSLSKMELILHFYHTYCVSAGLLTINKLKNIETVLNIYISKQNM